MRRKVTVSSFQLLGEMTKRREREKGERKVTVSSFQLLKPVSELRENSNNLKT